MLMADDTGLGVAGQADGGDVGEGGLSRRPPSLAEGHGAGRDELQTADKLCVILRCGAAAGPLSRTFTT